MSIQKITKKSVVLLCIIFAGCLLASPWVQAASTYKIGGIFAVTGPASFLGDPEKKSMEMAVKAINDAGGIDGHLLETVIYDTESDPTKGVMAVNKLINKDRVLAIIGPSRTPTTLAVISFVERAQIPLISCAAGIQITQPVKKWVFKTAQSDVLAVASLYSHLKAAGIQKVGILTVSNAFGESGKHQLEAQAGTYGIEIVKVESFGAKDTDMTPQLTKIRKSNPQAVICWGTNPGPAVVARNVKQLKMDMPLFMSHGVASPKFIDLAGEAAEGICLPSGKILVAGLLPADDVQKEILMQYIQQFESQYGGKVSGFGGYAFDAVNILAGALKGSGGDRAVIRAAIEKMENHVGVSGVFTFSTTEHNGLGPDAFVVVKIKNNTWELLR